MRQRSFAQSLTLAAIVLPGMAQAHNFKTGTAFPQIIDATGAALNDPVLLLTLIPLGLMASIWQPEGLLKIWGPAAIGLLAGIPLAVIATPWFAVPALMIGIACAVLGILSRDYSPLLMKVMAGAAGLFAMRAVLEGHGFFQLPVAIYIGLFIGANAAFVVAAAIARAMVEKLPAVVARIAVRILASWTAAITLMLLAFQIQQLLKAG